ncbi:aminotransferase class I/II-fold pyridoxal phosphate-dependent enzyme [Nesterenkonia xinjiangensis]|uniref:DNA-binding transcriptional MocR family regulator n=1 Tax=Nesterenkonia xinjiangensis TaxID=225327 RepID=A0A7Z0GNK5_9MICC|nr:aminotransferase class I/II-fold pyridoxal phosphate-dependent enzyme [Nesterenkonia xinjiangensis]NYJ78193.1 DNA-binding transcriptional MocR family regulator [Nesterenkonia xinjiangensis]
MNDKYQIIAALNARGPLHDGQALADAVLSAVRTGDIPEGSRMPTIVEVAEETALSTATVSRAWSSLGQLGVVRTRRRGGTVVVRPSPPTAYRHRGQEQTNITHYLSAGYPDPELLVELPPLLQKVAHRTDYDGYAAKDRISSTLFDRIMDTADHRPESALIYTDVMAAMYDILRVLVPKGRPIIVGEPDFPLYALILRQLGLKLLPVPLGPHGYDLARLEEGLQAGASTMLLQTRVQNPTGLMIPNENVQGIADLLLRHDGLALEVDHHLGLAPEASVRLAALAPSNTLLMISYGKVLHPDIRVAPLLGPEDLLYRISTTRMGSWVSALNRNLLEAALTDPEADATIDRARKEYARRRTIFTEAFARRGLEVESNAGVNMWLPVRSEEAVLARLAEKGISVSAGREYSHGGSPVSHIYLSLGLAGADPRWIAEACAEAALEGGN